MSQADTRFLIREWTRIAGPDGRARAGAFRPESLGARLPRAIVIERLSGSPSLRIAGGWIESLHGRPLKGCSLFDLWRDSSATLVASSLLRCVQDRAPVVLTLEIGVRRQRLELALVPLTGATGAVERVLGLFTPLKPLELSADDTPLLTARLSLSIDQPLAATARTASAPRRPAA